MANNSATVCRRSADINDRRPSLCRLSPDEWPTISRLSAEIDCYALNMTSLQRRALIDFSLTVMAATLIFISGRGSAISSAKQGYIYNLVKN